MGSGKHRFSLAEILNHGYGERVEDSPVGSKSLEELERSLGSAQDTEMPLEELLALYGYEVSDPHSEHNGEPSELPASLPDMTLDKDQIAKDLLSGEEEEETQSSADDLTPSVTSHSSDIFRRHLRGPPKRSLVYRQGWESVPSRVPVLDPLVISLVGNTTAHCLADEDKESCGSLDENTDGSSIPSNDGHKDIMVGPQYQAAIPPLSTYSYRERAYENEDQLLWAPGVLSGEAVEEFLLQAQRGGSEEVHMETPMSGPIIKDSEQALYELVKCRFNTEEALRRLRFNVKVFREELCAWSEEECRNFEHGYRVHGKNFHLIQANKVRTRSVGECVEYYYMWKKSDRHEYFTLQTTKLGRKKFSLQSGTMEDVEQDGEGVGMEGSSHSSSFPSEPVTMPHPEALDRDKRGVELEREVTELCGTSGQLSHFQAREDLQGPGADRTCSVSCPTPPQAQLNIPPGTHGGTPPPELLGPGFYQLQLGPFLMDSRFSLSSASPPPTTAVAPAVSVPSEFGPVGSFLCPPVLRSPPGQHPHSLT